ncbi:hypothetical protein, partial [Niveispirillum sp.]|uniref:hypothetical protein n=1 Tax=Niveispirillum sp. TaxID=1917217 RepID=UPI001B78594D
RHRRMEPPRRGPAMTHSDTDPAVNPEPRLPVNSPGLTAGGFSPVAALFVETGGSYWGLPDVDPWDETRDARQYAGPWPVVAHPPCQRWGKFWAGQPLWIARTGERKAKGDDVGCFAAALSAVQEWGGVLEHPEGSHAWAHFGLNKPPRSGGWVRADDYGWTCCVEQGQYGHYARKPTWLLVYGLQRNELPELRWGKSEPTFPQWAIDRYGLAKCKRAGELAFKGGGKDSHHRIGTPPEFRDLLLAIARSAA